MNPEPRRDVSPTSDFLRGGGSRERPRTNTNFAGWGRAKRGDDDGDEEGDDDDDGDDDESYRYLRARSDTPAGDRGGGGGDGGGPRQPRGRRLVSATRRQRATPSPSPPTASLPPRPASTSRFLTSRRRDDVHDGIPDVHAAAGGRSGSRAGSRTGSVSSTRSFSSSASAASTLPAIAAAAAAAIPRRRDPEEDLKRRVTALADESSRVKAAAKSRERTLRALQLQLAESSRVAAASADAKTVGNAALSHVTIKSRETEFDASIAEARGATWDALRIRSEAERLEAQRAAAEAKRALAAAAKDVDEAKAECERAAKRAEEVARRLDDARDDKDAAGETRERCRAMLRDARASLSSEPEQAASLMRDARLKRARGGGGGVDGNRSRQNGDDAVVVSGRAASFLVSKRAQTRGMRIRSDVAEDIVSAAEARILVETGVGSAAEVARRMCGGHDETEAALKGDVAAGERRVRRLKRELRDAAEARDEVSMNESAGDAKAAEESAAVSAAEATLEASGAAAAETRTKAARTAERVARATIGIVNLLETLKPAAAAAKAAATAAAKANRDDDGEEQDANGGDDDDLFDERRSALVERARASIKPDAVMPIFAEAAKRDAYDDDGGDREGAYAVDADDEGDAVETTGVLRTLGNLEIVLDQVCDAAEAAAAAAAAARSTRPPVATSLGTVAEDERGERDGGSREEETLRKQQRPEAVVAGRAGRVAGVTLAGVTLAGNNKENESVHGGGGKGFAGHGLNRSKAANNRRVTLTDYYAGGGDAHGRDGEEREGASGAVTATTDVTASTTTTTTKKNNEGGVTSSSGGGGGFDAFSAVDDAHRLARLAMRGQDKIFAAAAKKTAARDKAAAADAARVAANDRFVVGATNTNTKTKTTTMDVVYDSEADTRYLPCSTAVTVTRTRRKHWGERFALDNDSDDDSDDDDDDGGMDDEGEVPRSFIGAEERAKATRRGLSLAAQHRGRESVADGGGVGARRLRHVR